MIRYYCDYCGKEIKTTGKKAGVVYKLSISRGLLKIENEYQLCFPCRCRIINLMKGAMKNETK